MSGGPQSLSFRSPLGLLTLTEEGGAITRLDWEESDDAGEKGTGSPLLLEAKKQLEDYFAGRRRAFELPLAPKGSAFQQSVWRALQDIPFGETRTYGALARELGSVARAVGGACGANPIAIVIPCHRVLASGGRLCGFSSSGGLKDKRRLLDLEQGSPGLPFG